MDTAMSAASSVPTRPLGSTGEHVSCLGVGGAHLGKKDVDEKLAIRIIRSAIDEGITFLDNSWDYHNGASERRMGKALREGYRDRAFVMTKIDGRSRKAATEQLEESLKRLRVDCIDLVQHHEIIRFEDANRIFRKDGAQEALEKARSAGKLRYIGFTGHKDPNVHLYMLRLVQQHGARIDTVQMPLNVMDTHYRSFEKLVLPELVRRGIGVLGMKSMAQGIILKSKTVTAEECLRYALSLPTSVVITGIDSMKILKQALNVARTFRPMSEPEMNALRARTREAAEQGEYELFKTSTLFDSTAEHPEWLGEEPKQLQALVSE
ncbi:MAG TPA: aldo/keto reductase [Gemmatimonadales bacterium]|nr:aldo/keto reductase [Gemmatimonadales bacterium]